MVYKIYKSNNYIIVIDENDNYFEEHCANVLVTKLLTPSTTYNITFFRPESTPQAFYNVAFADIRQQSGAPYANVAAWESWYTLNTGLCSNAAVLNSILATLQAQTDVEGVFVRDTGNLDKIVLQVKVWDQDSQTYIATYYYNPDGTLYTPVGPLEWVGTAGAVTADITSPLGDITACADAVAVTFCAAQSTEFFDQGDTLDDILTELTTGTLDVNITNTTLAVTQSGVWSVEAVQSGTWTVALDAATITALQTVTVNQGTSPWVVSATALDIRPLDCDIDSIKICEGGNNLGVGADGSISVNLVDSTNGTQAVVNPDGTQNNAIYGYDHTSLQNEQITSVEITPTVQALDVNIANSVPTLDVAIVNPLGVQGNCDFAVSTALCQTQEDILTDIKTAVQPITTITPNIQISSGDTATAIAVAVYSVTFFNNGSVDVLVSFSGGGVGTYVNIPAGTSITMDAGGINNQYPANTFYYDTFTADPLGSLIVTYNS